MVFRATADALKAAMLSPLSVAVDSSGNLFIVETATAAWRVDSKGIITTIAGTGAPVRGDGSPRIRRR
jgi:hypothetical protein